jgi:hypothetical protein
VLLCVHCFISLKSVVLSHRKSVFSGHIQDDSLEVSIFWEVIVSVAVNKDLQVNMGLILNDYRDTDV